MGEHKDILENKEETYSKESIRGILDKSVSSGIIDSKQKNQIWSSWSNWSGNVGDFFTNELRKIVKPAQYSLLKRKLFID